MTTRGNWGRETGQLLKEIDIRDLRDQLGAVRDYLEELTSSFSKIAKRQWRSPDLGTVQEAEEIMKENFVASLVVALGLGVLIGYMMRSTD